jgi:methylenetetrahydrofolate dehydrogenase (NADP+)/methenyltetrahydrofolate cyclohydrolase
MINTRCDVGAKVLDGKSMAQEIKEELKARVRVLEEKHGRRPGLAIIMAGENPASQIYVRNKIKACEELNIRSETHSFPRTVSGEELLNTVLRLNRQENIDGLMIQLPLPPHLDAGEINGAVVPEKDVDGQHPCTLGRLLLGRDAFLPCTPMGILEMLRRSDTRIAGREAVIIGRSAIVGKPLALLLLREDATVTICHSRSENLNVVSSRADILVAAAGRPKMVTADYIKEGAVVIDVGINRVNGRVVGDVDYEDARKKASAVSPVPGGVGPMTIAMLAWNTILSAELRLAVNQGKFHTRTGGG